MSLTVLRNFLISKYLSFDKQSTIAIDATKMSSIIFSSSSNLYNPDVNLSLVSQTKCDNMFSDPKLDHIFPFFRYAPGLYFVSSCML